MRVCVLADDLTGAAEIAGIGLRYGLATRLVREPAGPCGDGLTVVDTDSRSLAPADAAERVRQALLPAGAAGAASILFFKKTDSVLRGPLLAELEAAMAALGKTRVLLVPQNPSRGRTVRAGRYAIDGVALDQTSFAYDPEYPRHTAQVLDLLGRSSLTPTQVIEPGENMPERGILFGGAEHADDVAAWAARLDGQTLPAGGADFFQAFLEHAGLIPVPLPRCEPGGGRVLAVCGSASAPGRQAVAQAQRDGAPVCAMPDVVFASPHTEAQALESWCADIVRALQTQQRAVIALCQPIALDPARPQRLTEIVADVVARVLAACKVDELLLEGGATASAIVRRMGWHAFAVCGELAPGVVQMRAAAGSAPLLTLKPGSYPWPAGLDEITSRNITPR
jgi:uncharacterized protein YgbK (DUF1537 family)